MKQKGFTIIELLAVITLLALFSIVIVPAVFSSLDQAKNKEYDRLVATISSSAESYYLNNINDYSYVTNVVPTYISLMELVDKGHLKGNLRNPLTDNLLDERTLVKIIKNADNTLNIQYTASLFRSGINYRENVSLNTTIQIKSDDVIASEVVSVSVNGSTVTLPYTLNTSEAKTNSVVYTVKNDGKEATLIRVITVS